MDLFVLAALTTLHRCGRALAAEPSRMAIGYREARWGGVYMLHTTRFPSIAGACTTIWQHTGEFNRRKAALEAASAAAAGAL